MATRDSGGKGGEGRGRRVAREGVVDADILPPVICIKFRPRSPDDERDRVDVDVEEG